ncbi:MAG: ferrous iron transport protein B [Thermoguttaceae bacterium]
MPQRPTPFTIALIGNPNTGKSTLFSALVGVHQHVGNYPGVTVEKKLGRLEQQGCRFEVIDLPGLYSLAPRSRDEMVAVDVLLGRREETAAVDAVVCVVDAANLQRNFYLLSQVLELGLPTVVAVNMVDVAARRGISIDFPRLQERLAVAVVPTEANHRVGLDELKAALVEAVQDGPRSGGLSPSPGSSPGPRSLFPEAFEQEVARLEAVPLAAGADGPLPRSLVRRLLLDSNGYLQRALLSDDDEAQRRLSEARGRLARAGCCVPAVETEVRYRWARATLDGVMTEPRRFQLTAGDRADRLLTHRVWGLVVFALLMLAVFQAIFVWAQPASDAINLAAAGVGGWVSGAMSEGPLRSLLVDGVIGGVGSVLAFLPQILLLFFFIAVLEDCGYMARAACLMDRLMSRVGLSGRSFIPMLSSCACAVPGVMAARVIENERDRLTTILVAPLMTCSARLQVYVLLIAAFIPAREYCFGFLTLPALVLAGFYALGIVAAVAVAMVLKRTLLRGPSPPLLMELPGFQWPSPRAVLARMLDRGWVFLRSAGTVILAISIVVWAALYYPHDPHGDQRQSLLGRLGRVIEPAVRPLGWDWRIGCAVLASFPQREVVVATLGVMFNGGQRVDVESAAGQGRLRAQLQHARWEGGSRPLFTIPVALSVMVFFALCAQCAATLAVIRRETNSWRWPAFTFAYMTVLAYIGAFLTYQVGTWWGG